MISRNNEVRAKKILFVCLFEDFYDSYTCNNCRYKYYYFSSSYEFICKKCKSKQTVYRNTFFHNKRFGLSKTLDISIDYLKSEFRLTTVSVSKKYKISQKSASRVLSQVRNNKPLVRKLKEFYILKNSTLNMEAKAIKVFYNSSFLQ